VKREPTPEEMEAAAKHREVPNRKAAVEKIEQ
jgi:hypothetical protein